MTDDDQRTLGRLTQAVDDLRRQAELNRAEQRADFAKVFAELDEIKSNGCVIGAHNAATLKTLQGRPERALSVGAIIIASLAAVMQIFKFWRME